MSYFLSYPLSNVLVVRTRIPFQQFSSWSLGFLQEFLLKLTLISFLKFSSGVSTGLDSGVPPRIGIAVFSQNNVFKFLQEFLLGLLQKFPRRFLQKSVWYNSSKSFIYKSSKSSLWECFWKEFSEDLTIVGFPKKHRAILREVFSRNPFQNMKESTKVICIGNPEGSP